MLPSSERLRRQNAFERVYKARKCVYTPVLTLCVLERNPRSRPALPLVGFVIGKKAEAKAVARNRAKRRVREAYRLYRQELLSSDNDEQFKSLKQWYAIVWQIKSEALDASFQDIRQSVKESLATAAEKFGRKGLKSTS